MMNIHYHQRTGEIISWGSATHKDGEKSHFADHLVAVFPKHREIDPALHKMDIKRRRVVSKTSKEKAAARAIQRSEVDGIIRIELSGTDALMVPDRPIDADLRARWRAYRQALRDLSKLSDVAAMLKAWPHRPDQFDPIAGLRGRLKETKS